MRAHLAPPSSGPAARKFSSGAPASLIPSANFPTLALAGRQACVGHSSASFASRQKTTVSLMVAGLGLAGSVDAGRSIWRVTRKTVPVWANDPPGSLRPCGIGRSRACNGCTGAFVSTVRKCLENIYAARISLLSMSPHKPTPPHTPIHKVVAVV